MKNLPKVYSVLLRDIRKKAKANGFKIRTCEDRIIYAEGDPIGSAGYFSEHLQELAYSTFGNTESIASLIIHESSHMDQYLEDSFLWEKCSVGYLKFFEWLPSNEEADERLNEFVDDIIRLEKDCEERAVKKIIKYNLPIDIDKYIQKANCYLYGYRLCAEHKQFYANLYNHESVYGVASKRFKANYDIIPGRLRKAFLKRIKELNINNV